MTYFASVCWYSGRWIYIEMLQGLYTEIPSSLLARRNDTCSFQMRNCSAQPEWHRHWTSKNLATCETPEVHSLPLNIAGDINTSHYSRDQFGRVFVSIRVRPNTHWSEYEDNRHYCQKVFGQIGILLSPHSYKATAILFTIEQLCITSTGAIITQGRLCGRRIKSLLS